MYEHLGPGHTEKVYETAFAVEAKSRGFDVQQAVDCVVTYKGVVVGKMQVDAIMKVPGFDAQIILEMKAVQRLSEKEHDQVRKYLAPYRCNAGWLVNFGAGVDVVCVRAALA